ncbi:P2X purinoceptor 7-like [Ornithodoros turicata]|uniref:P2X purinoceptor 7-like n=1 Tax=Ornithodoros turicata TaxID=34597 RepID=UPI0031395E98
MSDSESSSSLWESENEFSDDLGVRPYIFDPQLGSDEESGDAQEHAAVGRRVEEFDWCSCGNCMQMEDEISSVCCNEQGRVQDVMEDANVLCITYHHLFHKHCLDADTIDLEKIKMLGTDSNSLGGRRRNKAKRYIAYRQFIFWIYHRLGEGNRVVIPSCAIRRIRDEFPSEDGDYTGFRHAQH